MAARGAKQSGRNGWSDRDDGRCRCAGRTSVKSCETDRENGYENRSPVFSYERSPMSQTAKVNISNSNSLSVYNLQVLVQKNDGVNVISDQPGTQFCNDVACS